MFYFYTIIFLAITIDFLESMVGENKLVDLNYSPVIDTASLRTDNASWFGF